MRLPCKTKTIIAFLLAVLLSGVLLLVVYPIYNVSAIYWPEIDSYVDLLEDCDQLLQEYNEGVNLPRSVWPEPLLRMNPRYVFVEDGYIDIVMSSGGIGDSWGLIVVARTQSGAVPLYMIKTKNPRVFKYK